MTQMKKINANEARRLLQESREQKAKERKQNSEAQKAEKTHRALVSKTLKTILNKALEVAIENRSSVVFDEDTYDLIADELLNLGYTIEEVQISKTLEDLIVSELADVSSKILKVYETDLQRSLNKIRWSAIAYDEGYYLGEIEEMENASDPIRRLAIQIITLGKIRDFYEEDNEVELEFDSNVGTALQDIAPIIDRHYISEFDEDYEETAYKLDWSESYDPPETAEDNLFISAHKLKFISSKSDPLFRGIEESVDIAVASNKSYFYIDIDIDDTGVIATLPNGDAFETPLTADDLERVLEIQEFHCEMLKKSLKSGIQRIKVAF